LAVAALGPDRVEGVALPSKFSSEGSITDAMALAEGLGIRCDELSISPAVEAVEQTLKGRFAGTASGLAEENVQARMRGLLLMALSNKFGRLVLTTGNKSEMAVGYCTLYGDMNGGLAVLADVYKMDVYALAEYINAQAGRAVIPISTITKPPSAELRPDQKDEDSLPPYPVLDEILLRYIEKQQEAPQIASETGYDVDLVIGILNMVDRNEYKRRQAAPGLRVSTKAFGTGRRIPIVMKWHRERPS
jgi:NAD+ synthase (glutamine-hydrolysing)